MQIDRWKRLSQNKEISKSQQAAFMRTQPSRSARTRERERERLGDVRIISCLFVSGDLRLHWCFSHSHINNGTWIKHGRQSLSAQWKHCSGFSKYFIFMSQRAFEVWLSPHYCVLLNINGANSLEAPLTCPSPLSVFLRSVFSSHTFPDW